MVSDALANDHHDAFPTPEFVRNVFYDPKLPIDCKVQKVLCIQSLEPADPSVSVTQSRIII